MEIYEHLENITTKEDFIKFLQNLSNDNQKNNDEWINKNISTFLSSISSWTEDMEGYYENMNIDIPKSVDWNFIATLFYIGKFYE